MCILLASTTHPEYPFILLFNRDEFLSRPTARASWWTTSPASYEQPSYSSEYSSSKPAEILSGRDLVRPTHGTWLGLTRTGRVAALTNICESSEDAAYDSRRSRGEAPILFLDSHKSTEPFVKNTVNHDGFDGIGGLSLFCADLSLLSKHKHDADGNRNDDGGTMAVLSNGEKADRVLKRYSTSWLHPHSPSHPHDDDTFGMSNSTFDDAWPKVTNGTALLEIAIADALIESSKSEITKEFSKRILLEKLFEVLCSKGPWPENDEDVRLHHLKNSVFIPEMVWNDHVLDEMNGIKSPLPPPSPTPGCGTDGCGSQKTLVSNGRLDVGCVNGCVRAPHVEHETDKRYGTKEQTVILVDKDGHVTFVERTLHDGKRWLGNDERDSVFEFEVEGW